MRYKNVLIPDHISAPKKGWRQFNAHSAGTLLCAGLIILAVILLGLSIRNTAQGIHTRTEDAMAFCPVQSMDQLELLGTYSVDSGDTHSCATIESAPYGDLMVTIFSEFEPQVLHARLLENSTLDVDRIGLGSISVHPRTGTVKISFKNNEGTQLCEFYR